MFSESSRTAVLVGCVCAAVVALAGCGSASGSSPAGPAAPVGIVKPPASIASSKTLAVCSDEVEPPFAYRQGTSLTGSEVDITTDAARDFGVTVQFRELGFDGLFAALDVGKCDIAIDEVSDTVAREQTIRDVDYMAVGQTFAVRHGNPQHLDTFANLCGQAVGAVLASVDLTHLQAVSHTCTSSGKVALHIVGFNDDPTGIEALITGKINAFEEDTPILAGLIARAGGQVQFSPQAQVNRIPVGLAVAHGNTELANALQKVLNDLYRTGAMNKIFATYHESGVGLVGATPVKIDAAGTK
jgi:polar amino acid transport system substrate-binding protein